MPTIRTKLDLANPPRLTKEQKAHYDATGDDQIDYTDASELDDEVEVVGVRKLRP